MSRPSLKLGTHSIICRIRIDFFKESAKIWKIPEIEMVEDSLHLQLNQ